MYFLILCCTWNYEFYQHLIPHINLPVPIKARPLQCVYRVMQVHDDSWFGRTGHFDSSAIFWISVLSSLYKCSQKTIQ